MALHAGIEIDGSEVCIAVIESTTKATTIIDYAEGRITGESSAERLESLAEILTSAFEVHRIQTVDIVTSIPTRMTTLREISVPFTRDDVIAKTVRFESEGHLPSVSIDDLIIEYLKCSETEDSSRLLICAVKKDAVGAHLEMLMPAGVDPVQVEVDATALASSFHIARPDLRGGRTLLVGMEAGHTTFVLLEEGRITRLRSTSNHLQPSGVPTLTMSGATTAQQEEEATATTPAAEEFAELMQQDESSEVYSDDDEFSIAVVSDEEFEKLNEEMTTSPTLPPADPDEVVERLLTEIERTFAGVLMRTPLDRIVVAGSAASDLGIAEKLAEEFEVPTQQLRVCDGVDTKMSHSLIDRCNRSGGVAVGLALQSAGQGLTKFDLRKEEHRFERRFAKLLPGLLLMGAILCALSVSWLLENHWEKQYRRAEYDQVRLNQKEMYLARFGEAPKTPNPQYVRSAERKINELKGGPSGGSKNRITQFLPGLDLISDITEGIASANPKVYPTWKAIEINSAIKKNGMSKVVFIVPDASAAERAVSALERKSKYFTVEDSVDSKGDEKQVTLKLFLKASITETKGRR